MIIIKMVHPESGLRVTIQATKGQAELVPTMDALAFLGYVLDDDAAGIGGPR